MARGHFVNNTLSELQEANSSPIYGYQHLPILTLEESIEKINTLVPGVIDYVAKAKENCNRNSTLLTWDESASIYLYTMPISFFSCLNNALRAEDRHELKPWFAFLKLFITALEKLPSTKQTVWRGVSGDVSSIFGDGDVHIWWSINSCSMDLKVVERYLDNTSTLFAIDASHGKDISAFSTFPDEQEIVLMPGTRLSAKCQSLNYLDYFFLVHLEEKNSQSESQNEASYLFGLIKQKYQQNSRIEHFVNPSKSFPIEHSYINLAIVEIKEQQEREKKLLNAKLDDEIMGTYEEIYGTKTKIEIKSIFERCKDQTKNILVLGRAGIGKTTFCRYVAYQWATGAIWQQYQLVIFIHLRNLTESRYPLLTSGIRYSLVDLVKTEYFHDVLSEKHERLLKEQLGNSRVLWLLDGYDEIVQNVPPHLKYLLEQLLRTPNHILTSRPYSITLSYNIQLEITGFTDDNIKEYAKQFFHQITDELDNAQVQGQKLLTFLESNPRIWGIAHIPVNLELICSLWCDTDWSETTILTMTNVYDKMTEWLCRRHLEKQNISSNQMTKEDVYEHFHKELAFLESLAFNGMESKSIILPPKLLRIASTESRCSLQYQSHLLNIGILKSLDYKSIGTRIEADKSHYFLHLSFQEHFAARYLVKALNGTLDQKQKAIDFIKFNKYNQRFELVFTFASGLLLDYNGEQCMNIFWKTLLGEPLDLIGIRHVQIVISCLEEAGCNRSIPQYDKSIDLIIKWINYFVPRKDNFSDNYMLASFKRSPSLVNQPAILDTILKLYEDKDHDIKWSAYTLICNSPISSSSLDLVELHLNRLNNQCVKREQACEALSKMGEKAVTTEMINRFTILISDADNGVRDNAYKFLRKMGKRAATNEVISRLVILLDDTNTDVKINACRALKAMGEGTATKEVINRLNILLGDVNDDCRSIALETLRKMGKTGATNDVINSLLILLGDTNQKISDTACETLCEMGENIASNKLINRLMSLLDDTNCYVRNRAIKVVGKIGQKAATSEMINTLMTLLGDTNGDVSYHACEVLCKMGGKAVANKVINRLVNLLDDADYQIKTSACKALGGMGENAATNEVLNRLLILLTDTNEQIRTSAWVTLEKIGGKVATNEAINRLLIQLTDTNEYVRRNAWETLGRMGEKAATNEVINRLLILLGDPNEHMRWRACEALGKMDEKAATNEVINRLLVLLADKNNNVIISAREALCKMGEKAATNEVINTLLILLGDTNSDISHSACKILVTMGEKAATNEVINRIMILLDDDIRKNHVKRNACKALEEMGEKAAMDEVINRLQILLGDLNEHVRWRACKALGKMGKKAATNEVISTLLILLPEMNEYRRRDMLEILGKMGENIATNEVIDRLLLLLDDRTNSIRRSACEALGKMGKKAAAKEVINKLLVLLHDSNYDVHSSAFKVVERISEQAASNELIGILLDGYEYDIRAPGNKLAAPIRKILYLLPSLSDLQHDTVQKLSEYNNVLCFWDVTNISPKELMTAFLKTAIVWWLPIMKTIFMRYGYGISVTEASVIVHDSKESIDLPLVDRKIGQQLRDYFANCLDN